MSKITVALEAAVTAVIENTPSGDSRQSNRQRVYADRAFATILKLIAPRIRHFIRQYGLVAHWDDAEQCCAIGVHRAIQGYDPAKAQFTTFVNWQIRGELQSLRFRLMTDQRPSAKKVDATTVSLHAVSVGADGEETSLEAMIVDETALALTEAGASDYLAEAARAALIDQYVEHLRSVGVEQLKKRAGAKRTPVFEPGVPRLRSQLQGIDRADLAELDERIAEHRAVIERRVFEHGAVEETGDPAITRERLRQITKRAAKTMAELATSDPRFAIMAEGGMPATRRPRARPAPTPAILPDPLAAHNRFMRVTALVQNDMPANDLVPAGVEVAPSGAAEPIILQ